MNTLNGHQQGVRSLSLSSSGRLISGSEDKTIRIWNALTGKCEEILDGHDDFVRVVLGIKEERVVSGSRDNSLRIWDIGNK